MSLLDPPALVVTTAQKARLKEISPRLTIAQRADIGSLVRRENLSQPATMATAPTFAYTGPGGSTPITSGVLVDYNDTRVTLLGCVPQLVTQFSTNYYGNFVNDTWTRPLFAVEFWYYGSDFCLRYRDEAGASNRSTFWLWVDGQPATAADQTPTTTPSAGSLFRCRFTFASAALRRIRIYLNLGDYGGIEIGPNDIVYPTPAPTFRPLFLGDSWTETTAFTGPAFGFAQVACRRLGNVVPYMAGQGSTGYITPSTTRTVFGSPGRLAGVVAANPTHIFILGSINDASDVGNAPSALYAALKSSLPDAKLYVAGLQPLGGLNATQLANNASVISQAQAAGIKVFDMINENWQTAGSRSWAIGVDNTHPTPAGADYFGTRTADAILAAGL